jgi:hypothetical protein
VIGSGNHTIRFFARATGKELFRLFKSLLCVHRKRPANRVGSGEKKRCRPAAPSIPRLTPSLVCSACAHPARAASPGEQRRQGLAQVLERVNPQALARPHLPPTGTSSTPCTTPTSTASPCPATPEPHRGGLARVAQRKNLRLAGPRPAP